MKTTIHTIIETSASDCGIETKIIGVFTDKSKAKECFEKTKESYKEYLPYDMPEYAAENDNICLGKWTIYEDVADYYNVGIHGEYNTNFIQLWWHKEKIEIDDKKENNIKHFLKKVTQKKNSITKKCS